MTGHDREEHATQMVTIGGSTDAEVTEVAVNPTGSSAPAVMTATVLTVFRKIPRNAEPVTA